MQLFVGLGNPGAKYARTRHNIGFMALDAIAAEHGFTPWKSRFQGEVAEGRLGSEKVLLLKPQTFMNLSGNSVAAAAKFYKLDAADLTVFHDELDLAPGRLKVKQGGGHAGHNGLRSIHAHMGEAYRRVRLGIGHPGRKEAVSGYVLHDFPRADADWLDDLMRGLAEGAPSLAEGDAGRFMNAVAQRVAPPRSGGGEKPAKPKAPKPGKSEPPAQPAKTETPPPRAKPAEPAAEETPDPRSKLQQLVDRFR